MNKRQRKHAHRYKNKEFRVNYKKADRATLFCTKQNILGNLCTVFKVSYTGSFTMLLFVQSVCGSSPLFFVSQWYTCRFTCGCLNRTILPFVPSLYRWPAFSPQQQARHGHSFHSFFLYFRSHAVEKQQWRAPTSSISGINVHQHATNSQEM